MCVCVWWNRLTCQRSFKDVLNEVNDQAGQHELVAENLTSAVTKEIGVLVKDFKEDRKRVCLFLFCFVFVFVFVLFFC